MDEWIVSSERQTLCKLLSSYVLFTIDVLCEPLADGMAYPQAWFDLHKRLQRMDADEIQHFGGRQKHQRLCDYLMFWNTHE